MRLLSSFEVRKLSSSSKGTVTFFWAEACRGISRTVSLNHRVVGLHDSDKTSRTCCFWRTA